MPLNPAILRIGHADDDAITRIRLERLWLSPRNKLVFQSVDPQVLHDFVHGGTYRWTESSLKDFPSDASETELKHLSKPGDISGLKVVGDDGKLAARAFWGYIPKKEDRKSPPSIIEQRSKLPAGTNLELWQEFEEKSIDLEERYQPAGEHIVLMELLTGLDFARQGAGRRLVDWGLQQADKLGLPVFLLASPDGYPLYLKADFRELGQLTIDLEKYGGTGTHVHTAMLRDVTTPEETTVLTAD